jgi:serine protease Do
MKKSILARSISLLVLPLALAATSFAENKLPEIKVDEAPLHRTPENSFAPVVEKVAPSVVTISISKDVPVGRLGRNNPFADDPFFRKFFNLPDGDDKAPVAKDGKPERKKLMPYGLGSGVIVSADGYILTNNHVVEQADDIMVTLQDGKTEYKAKKIGTDPDSDIAVIKVEAQNLKPVTIADSDKIKVGDMCIAVGNPFALRQSVTMGIISATGRNQTGISAFGNFIQTDAAINPGNSGGALVDTEGRLIGVNTAIFSRTGGNMGIGFAVPSNQARSAMESLIKFGKVQRGFLGIDMQPLDEKLAREYKVPEKDGIVVTEIVNGGGAEKAGIHRDDVITELNGQPVGEIADFRNHIAALPPGTSVELKIFRDGKSQVKKVTLVERESALAAIDGSRPDAAPAPVKQPDVLDGVTVGEIKPDARKRFNIPNEVQGALVTDVNPDSPSADAEIKAGDVIVEIDGKEVKTADDAVRLSEEVKTKNSVRLRVKSRGTTRVVVVEERKEN